MTIVRENESTRRRCVLLFSGGLDSILAARLMLDQGIEVEALNFQTIFTCCQTEAARAASALGVRLTVISQADDYLELIRKPRFGYGKGANPCIDCRIYMFAKARQFMPQVGASFVVSGEVLGQRPKSQKRRDLELIPREADLDDLLLRPLSAKCLAPTLPEREGWVDRNRLFSFVGRDRNGLIRLAKQLGIREIPTPSNGCALTEVRFAAKVHDLIQIHPAPTRWDFELLKVGRHYRLDHSTKVIVGRREAENEQLVRFVQQPNADSRHALIEPENFQGPTALLLGNPTPLSLQFAANLIVRHSGKLTLANPHVTFTCGSTSEPMAVIHEPTAWSTTSLTDIA